MRSRGRAPDHGNEAGAGSSHALPDAIGDLLAIGPCGTERMRAIGRQIDGYGRVLLLGPEIPWQRCALHEWLNDNWCMMRSEIRDLSKHWYDQHHVLTYEEQREALAHTLARELIRGATWDGLGGLKEQGLIRSAHEGRALLREYGLDWALPSRRRTQ